MPDTWVRLYLALGGSSSGRDVYRMGFESKVPLSVAASDLMAECVALVAGWDDVVRGSLPGYARRPAAARTAAARAGQAGPTVEDSSRFLERHLQQLLKVDHTAGNEFIDWHRQALYVLGQDRGRDVQRLPDIPCPDCEQRTLVMEAGSDLIRCDSGLLGCRAWPVEDRPWLARLAAEVYGQGESA